MKFEKIVSKGISSNSYFIASSSEAAVIDPRRDVDIYLEYAQTHNVKITTIFDTHRNEDFVNGSPQLAFMTGAEIYHGHRLDFKYGNPVKEGNKFIIDDLEFEILETPGHTPESISITVKTDTDPENPIMVCTGDALFAGDVGRVDFYRDEKKQLEAAKWLYDSLFNKLLKMPEGTIVLPAHGAGSICGGGISGLPFTTIGYEKRTNTPLQLSKEEFIKYKSKEKFEIAPNMKYIEKFNLEGAPILRNEIKPHTLTVEELKDYMTKDVQIVDIREPESFAGGHIENTLSIWKNGLPTFALWMLDYEKPIVLIKSTHQEINQSINYLIRLGFDNIIGYLQGFRNWYMAGENYHETKVWSVHELKKNLDDEDLFILDVRTNYSVKENGQIKGSKHIFLGDLPQRFKEIPKDKRVIVYCDSGFKTFTGVSYLHEKGFKDVIGVFGSMSAWKNAGYPINEEE
ncbi:MAG: MBL fold metallo-hydrolase [Candidatus Heimdallarchaeota archaeon]|nr:MBL fold metallo-hydrolase [Candidatus Heimdallarchaeota archaeon]MCK4290286.1 MBL fold metallo-hydrolase [Candidatus Heimdallarchaeota archaeon]